ncbi:MAG: peptide deformylase [Bilophila sp.]
MPLNILTYPDPLLCRHSHPVTEITDELRTMAAEMTTLMYDAEGIGLAAPQVGKLVRLITVDISGPEKRDSLLILVNPHLTPILDAGHIESEEGCLSVCDYRTRVKRYAKVLLEATDLNGQPIKLEAEDLFSICLQHEVDHLDGRLFIDRISRLKRTMYEARMKKRFRQQPERHL